MTLKFVIGYSADIATAKERAVYFYNDVEGTKNIVAIESQVGINELNEPAWFTTIWFNLYEPVQEQEQKFEYIGSTTIDPNDPDWEQKWKESQGIDQETLDAEWRTNTDEVHNASVASPEGSGLTET